MTVGGYVLYAHEWRVSFFEISQRLGTHIFWIALNYVPCMHFGGDWIRQGKFEVGSKPWSPRHVNQGYCQI